MSLFVPARKNRQNINVYDFHQALISITFEVYFCCLLLICNMPDMFEVTKCHFYQGTTNCRICVCEMRTKLKENENKKYNNGSLQIVNHRKNEQKLRTIRPSHYKSIANATHKL